MAVAWCRYHWYVYIVRCADGTLYCGIAVDPALRARRHSAGRGGKYTRAASRRPVTLVYAESAASHGAALRREAAIKSMGRLAKLTLIAGATEKR